MKKIICFIVVSLFLLLNHLSTAFANVLDGAVEYNGHYYKVFHAELSWNNAKYFCKSMGGHLATAETSDENELLKSLAAANKDHKSRFGFYIGGLSDEKGFWHWLDGGIITYSDWALGRPYLTGSNCYIKIEAKSLKWHDVGDDGKDFGGNGKSYGDGLICEWDSKESAHESNW